MKSMILAIVFAVHAGVFARIYLARGRRLFSLLFVFGFFMLFAYYGYESWRSFGNMEGMPGYMSYVRWGGIALCVAGLPLFIASLARAMRAKSRRPGGSLDSKDAGY